jgi:hypothetical protein
MGPNPKGAFAAAMEFVYVFIILPYLQQYFISIASFPHAVQSISDDPKSSFILFYLLFSSYHIRTAAHKLRSLLTCVTLLMLKECASFLQINKLN